MTHITQLTGRKAMLSTRILTMILTGFVLIILQSGPVQAQWTTNGNNINNTNTGNVGIGTTTPASALDVRAVSAGITTTSTTGTNRAYFGSINTGGSVLMGSESSVGQSIFNIGTLPYAGVFGTTQARPIQLVTNQTARMTIDASGNVGIGTASPDINARLHLYNAPGAGMDIQSANAGGWSRLRLVTGTHSYGWFTGDSTQPDAPNKIGLYDYTVGAFRMMIDSSGNVGIGAANPANLLQVGNSASTANQYLTIDAGAAYQSAIDFRSAGAQKWVIYRPASATDLRFYDGTADRLVLKNGGNVGIGTSTPSTKLHVVGDGTITGNLTVTGNIAAKYQDVAEWVESSQALAAGTVVVLDHTRSNQVIASSQAYDTRVAGVISSQPGITLGEKGESKVLVATTGRVKVKVDASAGPIQVGDLLVTSDKEGVARKSEPLNLGGVAIHRPGTLIGKALEPLEKGRGEILVLLSLQ